MGRARRDGHQLHSDIADRAVDGIERERAAAIILLDLVT
jgi:hypothetical protein